MFRLPIVILLLHSGLAADAGEPPRAQGELSPATINRLKEVWASQEQRLADESNATIPGEEAKPTQGLLLTISPASHEATGTSEFAQYRDALFYTDESLVLSISLKNTTDQPLTCYSIDPCASNVTRLPGSVLLGA